MNNLQAAKNLKNFDVSAIPVNCDTKQPLLGTWSEFIKTRPDDARLARWFGGNGKKSIAAVGGKLVCIDIDVKADDSPKRDLFEQYIKVCRDCGLGGLIERCVIQQTMNGGYHLVFACEDDSLTNVALARRPQKEGSKTAVALIETRGKGGYFLISPSIGYELIQNDFSNIPTFTAEERDRLLAVAKSFDRCGNNFDYVATSDEQSPFDAYDSDPNNLFDLLKSHGWQTKNNTHWTRPGKDPKNGISATWGKIPDRFYVFSSATIFEANKSYKPSAIYSFLEHGGDFKVAAKELYRKGFGDRSTASKKSDSWDDSIKPSFETKSEDLPLQKLPGIVSYGEFMAAPKTRPPELITGVLFAGAKMIIAGPSKARKTFALQDLAISIATGYPWFGFSTIKMPVLYLNFELQEYSFEERLNAICKSKFGDSGDKPADLYMLHLRGYSAKFKDLYGIIVEFCKEKGVGLIILDPVYKFNQGETDENSAKEVGALLNKLEVLTHETGAALAFAHHFSKGGKAGTDSRDRSSGSGVWARDPDAILTMTDHEEEGCMSIDATLRNFKPIAPFGVRWNEPLWERDLFLDPNELKQKNATLKKESKTDIAKRTIPVLLRDRFQNKLENTSFRQLSEITGLTLGSVQRAISDLKSEGKIQ